MSTSFFNDRNRNIARELSELIVESNQELPEWLDKVANESRTASRGARRGPINPSRFGGRDHRVQQQTNNGMGMNRGGFPVGGGGFYNQGQQNNMMPSGGGFGGASRNGNPQNSNRAVSSFHYSLFKLIIYFQNWWD